MSSSKASGNDQYSRSCSHGLRLSLGRLSVRDDTMSPRSVVIRPRVDKLHANRRFSDEQNGHARLEVIEIFVVRFFPVHLPPIAGTH